MYVMIKVRAGGGENWVGQDIAHMYMLKEVTKLNYQTNH